MNEEPHTQTRVQTYTNLIAAFNANDLVQVRRYLDEHLTYVIPGRSPIAGRTEGIAAHIAVLRRARDLSGNTLKLTPLALAADGDYLIVWGRISAQRAGRVLDCDHCVMYRFEQTKIVEGRTVPTDLYSFDEFWSA